MKYFDISVNDSYRTSPQITNWYEEIKVRLINWETYHKLPRRKVLMITSSPNTIFTDIISFPFLLVSPMIKEVIRLYRDEVVFKEIMLLDIKNKLEKQYYLPVMEESSDIELINLKGRETIVTEKIKTPAWVEGRNIFWVKYKEKRHTIVSLDFAESILRRNAVGIGLQEVILSQGGKYESRKN